MEQGVTCPRCLHSQWGRAGAKGRLARRAGVRGEWGSLSSAQVGSPGELGSPLERAWARQAPRPPPQWAVPGGPPAISGRVPGAYPPCSQDGAQATVQRGSCSTLTSRERSLSPSRPLWPRLRPRIPGERAPRLCWAFAWSPSATPLIPPVCPRPPALERLHPPRKAVLDVAGPRDSEPTLPPCESLAHAPSSGLGLAPGSSRVLWGDEGGRHRSPNSFQGQPPSAKI